MKIRNDERGQVAVVAALSMTVVFGFMALAIDVGLLFNAHRKLQNAADAAATSAAIDYMFNASTTTATAAATSAISANQISNPSITVNFNPNITSAYHFSASYVEVIVSQTNPTFFAGMFNHKNMTISARAVAGMPGEGNACVIVLDPNNDSGAMTLQGSFTVDAGGCGVVVDSTSSDALQFTGGGGTLTAKYVSVVGGAGGQTGDSTPAPTTGAAPVANPLPSTSGPDPTTNCTPSSSNPAVSTTGSNIYSGQTYSDVTFPTATNGITCFTYVPTAHGSGSSPVTFSGTTTLPPGIAVFPNGLNLGGTVNSGSDATNNGTTIDVNGGALTVQTNTNLNVSAPTSAPVTTGVTQSIGKGVVIYQPTTNSNLLSLQTGSACGSVNGIIYAPAAQLYLNDSGGDHCGGTGFGNLALKTDLIIYQLMDKTATMNITNYNNTFGTGGPLTVVTLVE